MVHVGTLYIYYTPYTHQHDDNTQSMMEACDRTYWKTKQQHLTNKWYVQVVCLLRPRNLRRKKKKHTHSQLCTYIKWFAQANANLLRIKHFVEYTWISRERRRHKRILYAHTQRKPCTVLLSLSFPCWRPRLVLLKKKNSNNNNNKNKQQTTKQWTNLNVSHRRVGLA